MENSQIDSNTAKLDQAIWIESDLAFIQTLSSKGGDFFKKCFQCGTCSATCALSPDIEPFPSKEMAWAAWGMKDRLLQDPDIWLCYQCNDCTSNCPRGAHPGDVLATVREECINQYSFPRFLTRWVNQPKFIPLLLAIPMILLTLTLYLKEPIERAFGLSKVAGENITYAYSGFFPHWLLNSFFFFFIFFGFLGLSVVTLWVITSGLNPIIKGDFVYPFSFFSPWKVLANIGGLAVLFGCFLMIKDRMSDKKSTVSNYYDWSLIGSIIIVVLTGFATELLHYVHLEPHRHMAYFVHLVFVFGLLVYLPYSKFAHILYRTTAIVYAEYTGRNEASRQGSLTTSASNENLEREVA